MSKKRFLSLIAVITLLLTTVNSAFYANAVASDDGAVCDYTEYIDNYAEANLASETVSVGASESVTLEENGSFTAEFYVTEAALYSVKLVYTTLESGNEPLAIAFKTDGAFPCEDFEYIALPRYFEDMGDIRTDSNGNEISKEITQKYGEYEYTVKNENNTEELKVYLEEGRHSLEITNSSEAFVLSGVFFCPPEKQISYSEYAEKYSDIKSYDGCKILEAENTVIKSSYNFTQLSDNSSANVNPHSASADKVNYIGGSNWSQPGDTIEWEITTPEDGLYSLGINYRQNYTLNTTFYRELKIDGTVPFAEAAAIELPYALNWKFIELANKNGEPYLFYLTKGTHKLSLAVTLGELSPVCDELDEITYDLASLYRSIIMITGDTPDANRDYNLFDRIVDFEASLGNYIDRLNGVNKNLTAIFGSDSVSSVSTVNAMINVMELMLDNKYTAHRYLTQYYDNYASLSSMLMELKSMPLDIDRIYYGNNFENVKSGFFENLVFSVKRFALSFSNDYRTAASGDRERITLWVNWGRDQTKVLKYLIQSDFSVKHNIDVEIKITNATLTHAALSGNGPDLQLHLSRSEPVNLAMRDALYDLSQFEDYDEIVSRFMPTASDCYKFEDGVYALPDTQTFFMMFIRTDIFEELGLAVPKTWDEFTDTSVLLLRQNMQVGLPYTQIAEMTQVNFGVGALSIYPTLLIQNGGSLYSDDRSEIKLLSDVSIDTFTQWTNFYTKYGLPKTYDFFNRFRLGLMPMAIQSYTTYATLTAAAPEIADYWEMYELPGVVTDDGSIRNVTTGGGTGAVILSESEHKEAAWEFIKWWTSADVQYRYGFEVENILGSSARVATANVEALNKYSWRKSTLNNIMTQWEKVEEIPEVPGGYYVSRVLDQAFWNVTNAGENPKDMLMKWNDVAQTEITRKREQYGIK